MCLTGDPDRREDEAHTRTNLTGTPLLNADFLSGLPRRNATHTRSVGTPSPARPGARELLRRVQQPLDEHRRSQASNCGFRFLRRLWPVCVCMDSDSRAQKLGGAKSRHLRACWLVTFSKDFQTWGHHRPFMLVNRGQKPRFRQLSCVMRSRGRGNVEAVLATTCRTERIMT